MDDELAAILASADQSWANVRKWADDFERIAKDGPNGSARDRQIVRAGMYLLAMELELRKERWQEKAT